MTLNTNRMMSSGEHCQVVIVCLGMSVKILESFGTNQLIQLKRVLSTEKHKAVVPSADDNDDDDDDDDVDDDEADD